MSEGRQWIGDGLSGISTNGGGIGVAERVEDRMLTLLKRHEVQTLLAAGHRPDRGRRGVGAERAAYRGRARGRAR